MLVLRAHPLLRLCLCLPLLLQEGVVLRQQCGLPLRQQDPLLPPHRRATLLLLRIWLLPRPAGTCRDLLRLLLLLWV